MVLAAGEGAPGLCLQRTELVTRCKMLKFKKCLGSISREQSILQELYFQPARAALGIAFFLANFCPKGEAASFLSSFNSFTALTFTWATHSLKSSREDQCQL